MCLKPRALLSIPEDTTRLAQRLLSSNSLMRRIGDDFSAVLSDEEFASFYSSMGQPSLSPVLLSLVTILQFLENLSDRVTSEMVRFRMDWKYALHLPLDDMGFDSTVLCEFRQRLVVNQAQRLVFDRFLERFKEQGLLKGRWLQRTDSMAIFGAIRELNRLELVMETMRLALQVLAECDAEWFLCHLPAEWGLLYAERAQSERLIRETGPKGKARVTELLLQTGRHGFELLAILQDETTPEHLGRLEEVELLRRVLSQQYRHNQQGCTEGCTEGCTDQATETVELPLSEQLCEQLAALDEFLRLEPPLEASLGIENSGIENSGIGCQEKEPLKADVELSTEKSRKEDGIEDIIVSPHDPDARYAIKRGKGHTGYKLQLTETAAEDAPAIYTDLDIVGAADYDGASIASIQQRLIDRDLGPKIHLADTGYVCGPTLQASQQRGIKLLGPVSYDTSSVMRKAPGFAVEHFGLDFDKQQARCPAGHLATQWYLKERSDQPGQNQVMIKWSKHDCQSCDYQSGCISPPQPYRVLALSQWYPLIAERRREQKTEPFSEVYRRRSGMEASLSNTVNVHGGRCTPYRSDTKTLLYYENLCVGMNWKRAHQWQLGHRPQRSRSNRLTRLLEAAQKDLNKPNYKLAA